MESTHPALAELSFTLLHMMGVFDGVESPSAKVASDCEEVSCLYGGLAETGRRSEVRRVETNDVRVRRER